MPNPYVNKVVQADGTVIMDISDTTAVAADVVSGKTLYKADGEKVTGTASESMVGKRTGDPVKVTDGAADTGIKYFGAEIVPVQSGSGDPSPQNIRPITGWTSAEFTRTGINMFGGARMFDRVQAAGTSTVVDQNDHIIKYASSATTSESIADRSKVPFLDGVRYTFIITGLNESSTSGYANLSVVYTNGALKQYPAFNGKNTKTTVVYTQPSNKSVAALNKRNTGGTTQLYCDECAILEGVRTSEDFAPYQGETYVLDWSSVGTVYGGKVDLISGKLIVTHGYIASYAGETLPGEWISDRDVYAPNASPTTGAEVVYELDTPIEHQLTGATAIKLLSGTNYFWTSMRSQCEVLYCTSAGEDYIDAIVPVYQSKTNISPTASSQTITPDAGYDALSSVQINAMPSGAVTAPATITGSSASASLGTGGTSITLTKTVSVTPDVTTAGYISAGTAGNSDISLTATGTFSTTFVEGEFTTNSSTGVQSITIPYSGSGYPIMVVVVAKGGTYGNTTWKEAVQQYTVGCWSMTKSYMNNTPTYETSGSANYGGILVVYKSSASNKDSYARTGSVSNNTYTSSDPSNTALNCVKLNGNKAMKVYVNTGGYGLLQSTTYSYYILYSA